MKRALLFVFLPVALLRGHSSFAQDSTGTTPLPASTPTTTTTAAAIAAREDAEERYKGLATQLEAVQSDNQVLHAKIATLESELQSVRDAQAKGPDTANIQEELKKLAQAIQEVDKKRLEDKDAISEEIRKSMKGLAASIGSSPPPVVRGPEPDIKSAPSSTQDSGAVENGYSYTIQAGDTLGAVLKAYNKEFKSKGLKTITVKQAMEANPRVDWGRLRVGQKIVIPRPPGG